MAARNDAFVKPYFELLRKKSSYHLIPEGRRIRQLNLLTLPKRVAFFIWWRLRDSIADFALGAKSYGDSQFLNWLLRYATGISHLSGFESLRFPRV